MRLRPALQQPCSGWTLSNLRTYVADRDSVYAIRPLIIRGAGLQPDTSLGVLPKYQSGSFLLFRLVLLVPE
jgi:hypothetical protein